MVNSLSSILEWLSQWYANECDEYWEHLYGISGSMASTGQCQLQIDLDETIWEDIAFQSIASPHLTCEKFGTKFKIDCAADQLKEGLTIFKDWIEANDWLSKNRKVTL